MLSITTFPTKNNPKLCNQGSLSTVQSFKDLVEVVTRTAWSAGQFKENYRNNENFLGADFIAVDVDGGCTLSDAMEKYFKAFQYIIYKSKNHLKDKGDGKINDRFRVVLPLDRPIFTSQEYKATWNSLFQQFPFIDPAAKDPARFFYPGDFQSIKLEGDVVKVVTSLSLRTNRFLTEGAPHGKWNPELFVAAKDIQEQLYTIDQAIELLERPTKLPGNSGYLDSADMSSIHSAYSKPPMNPPRLSTSFMQVNEKGKVKLNIDQLCRDLLTMNFLLQVNNESTFIYSIDDAAKQEVGLCRNSDVLVRHLTQELSQLVKTGAISLKDGKGELSAEDLIRHWKRTAPAITEAPAPFGWPESNDWVIKRLSFSPTKGLHLAWGEFLSRLSDPEAFMAFVWSCFELKNRSRQALWLYGPEGQDGKSTVLNTLANCFGQAAAGLNNTQIRSDSRFALANFYNKRLIIYPDAKNTKFPMSELFRSLTSGDIVPIEFKGEGTVNVKLYVKLMIASNNEPEVTLGRADLSRLIRIDVEPSENRDDPTWEDKLNAELPYFLFTCREVYQQICPHGGQIRVSEKTQNLVADSAIEMQEPLQEIFDKHFEIADGEEISASALRTTLKDEFKSEDQFRNFKKFLYDRYKIKRTRVRKDDGSRPHCYVGIKLKTKNKPNLLRSV